MTEPKEQTGMDKTIKEYRAEIATLARGDFGQFEEPLCVNPIDMIWFLDAAERWLDIQDDIKAVRNEDCAGDEKHCSCVVHLRNQIKELRQKSLDKTTEHIYDIDGCNREIQKLTDAKVSPSYTEKFDEMKIRKLTEENDEIRKALESLSKRHEWSQHFDSPCICDEHVKAREVLERFKEK